MAPSLSTQLASALTQRAPLLAALQLEGTDCYRLFHGSSEGAAGLTVDRYGDMILVQSFHHSLNLEQQAELKTFYGQHFPELDLFYNDRSSSNSRIQNPLQDTEIEGAHRPRIGHELGVQYHLQARHEGQDPWLFLDLRAARRYVMQHAQGKSVLNLFAYTCGVGIAAAKAGARHVVNIDFAESALNVGKDNALINELPIRVRFIQSDAFAALRQLAGLGQPKVVRGKRMPPFPELAARQFDLVLLDPPKYAKSPFGVVDLVNDYAALFKPALLATAVGGQLICCNNVAQVARDAWLDQLHRSAAKAGRTISKVEWLMPEADFPSPDGLPPLKMVVLHV